MARRRKPRRERGTTPPEPAAPGSRTSAWLPAALVVVATIVAYVPAMQGGFIWDDDAYVTENTTLRDAGGLVDIWTDSSRTPQYYPLVFTTFWVEWQLWESSPRGYHVTNVLLHAANAVLVALVLLQLGLPGAWWLAAVFALHPVHVESVAWITERKNVLSGLFYLSSLLVYLRFEKKRRGRRSRWWALSFSLFVAALLSKTVTCSLPATILLLAWWRRGRIEARDVGPLLPFFALGLIMARTTAALEREHVGAGVLELGLSFVDRILLAGRAAWFYAGKLAWPTELAFIYPRWEVDASVAWQYLFPLTALAVLAAAWRWRDRLGRGPLTALLFFGGTLVPALGFIDVFPFRYSWVADHFQYLASLGVLVLAVAGLMHATRGLEGWRATLVRVGLPASATVVLGLLTWQQGQAYRDLETLWRDTLAKNPNATIARINLGNIVSDRGEKERALEHYRAALNVQPPERDTFMLARIHFNTGNNLYALQRYDDARRAYEASVAAEPRYYLARHGLGLCHELEGRVDEALEAQQRVLRTNPSHAGALAAVERLRRARPER